MDDEALSHDMSDPYLASCVDCRRRLGRRTLRDGPGKLLPSASFCDWCGRPRRPRTPTEVNLVRVHADRALPKWFRLVEMLGRGVLKRRSG